MWLYVESLECCRANSSALVRSGVSGIVTPAITLVGRELALEVQVGFVSCSVSRACSTLRNRSHFGLGRRGFSWLQSGRIADHFYETGQFTKAV